MLGMEEVGKLVFSFLLFYARSKGLELKSPHLPSKLQTFEIMDEVGKL